MPPPMTAIEMRRHRCCRRRSRDALAAHLVVAGDHGGAVAGRERRERRLHPRQRRIGVDVRQQRLHAGNQRLAVEQLADRDRGVERGLVALAPGALAEIGVEVGGRRDAAGEGAVRARRAARLRSRGTRRSFSRSPRLRARSPCRRRNPSARRCGRRTCRAGASPARRASAGRTAAGNDRDRSGSAFAPSPARWSRYRRPARRPARPCSRTAAAPARRQIRARRRAASAPPRRRSRPRRCRPSSGRAAAWRRDRRHHALALIERERGRLAGGAEHVEPVAAVVEQIARELGGARDVGRAVLARPGWRRRRSRRRAFVQAWCLQTGCCVCPCSANSSA